MSTLIYILYFSPQYHYVELTTCDRREIIVNLAVFIFKINVILHYMYVLAKMTHCRLYIDCKVVTIRVLTLKALNFFMKTLETKGFFQFETITNVLVRSFRFI